MRLAIYIAVLFAACAAGQATPSLPGTFGSGEPLPPPVAPEPGGAGAAAPATTPSPEAHDPGAEADFRDAKARFDAGDRAGARAALDAFGTNHPQHPFRPAADLLRARVALLDGDAALAKKLLEPLSAAPPDPGTGSGARYYLGLASVRLGEYPRARPIPSPGPAERR